MVVFVLSEWWEFDFWWSGGPKTYYAVLAKRYVACVQIWGGAEWQPSLELKADSLRDKGIYAFDQLLAFGGATLS